MMTKEQRDELIKKLSDTIRVLEALPIDTSCFTCKHFAGGPCEVWKEDVPHEHRDHGCKEWVYGVPF